MDRICMVPNCGAKNPSQGHMKAHQRKGDIVLRKLLVTYDHNKPPRWEMVWQLTPQGRKAQVA